MTDKTGKTSSKPTAKQAAVGNVNPASEPKAKQVATTDDRKSGLAIAENSSPQDNADLDGKDAVTCPVCQYRFKAGTEIL